MSDEWDFYFANVNDVVASLFVDLGIRDSIPDAERPWFLWSWVYFRHSRDDGLSSSEEAPILHQIEDALTKAERGHGSRTGRPHHDRRPPGILLLRASHGSFRRSRGERPQGLPGLRVRLRHKGRR